MTLGRYRFLSTVDYKFSLIKKWWIQNNRTKSYLSQTTFISLRKHHSNRYNIQL